MQWFDVDKVGLAKLLEHRGKLFAVCELLQNVMDTDATRADVKLEPLPGPYVRLSVEDDDPKGFSKLEHAFTLFAESEKKGDPTKRGRFNLGEKLVLALCRYASIQSTTGTVSFQDDGRTVNKRARRETGSKFVGEMKMTRAELDEVLIGIKTVLPPAQISIYVNGVRLEERQPVQELIAVTLPTEIADAEGYIRKSQRQTTITLYDPLPGETPHLYELGIPVVELSGDKWHVDIGQKVPLNIDRDNVTPAYLRTVRVEVLNATHDRLSKAEATASWVRDAFGDDRVEGAVVETITALRFGAKRVIADPTDPEGTKLAASKGYTVIPGGALSRKEWDNVKRFEAALPAGQVTPSPKPYSPGGRPERTIPVEKWTEGMMRFSVRARQIGQDIGIDGITIRFVKEPGVYWRANWGSRELCVNISKVGHSWFRDENAADQLALLIHEFGHHYSGDHLSAEYHRALCTIGAKIALLPSLWGLRT